MISDILYKKLEEILSNMPVIWDGRSAIVEMRDAGYAHWRQMEWIGFYFQFLCDNKLAPLLKIPGPRYGNVEFDGFSEIPWDFKAHPAKDATGNASNSLIVNDRVAIVAAIKEFGCAGLILAIGEATYDDQDRSFQIWHQTIKGGLSVYEKQRIIRKAPSRLRKKAFRLKEIRLILLDDHTVQNHGSFQEGFRNSNGNPRNAKVLLDLSKAFSMKTIEF